MTVQCVNLREDFGRRYRVRYEESYRAEHGRGRTRDPWLMILDCRCGHFLPWGGNLLAASVDGHPNIAGRLRALSCCTVVQDGNFGELTATFDVADFQIVAKIMKPKKRRRRVMTPEQRERLLEAAKKGRETLRIRRQDVLQSRKSTLESPAGG